jgi:4-alpha-glucanotransferase
MIAPLYNWLSERSSGVLVHPTCLPGRQGIGVLDRAVDDLLDLLRASGARAWQICPLGPTGYGDSPYQCFSAFAGNPYLIDLQALVDAGLLKPADLVPLGLSDPRRVDYGMLYRVKVPLLAKAAARFRKMGNPDIYGSFDGFTETEGEWLNPYAAFRAIKDAQGGRPWWEWPSEFRNAAAAIRSVAKEASLRNAAADHAFAQYVFFGQWRRVRSEASRRGIEIIGDLPIFVAIDAADVWADPSLFDLDPSTGRPNAVAGVPPDYFSSDGQLWGNPLYRWDRHRGDGFAWWRRRMRSAFALHDIVRIDHFRGFESHWRVPGGATTARDGSWEPGPGLPLFQALHADNPDGRIIAEDLGLLTPEVVALREQTGLPGMAVLQFAFGGDAANFYLPHNHVANCVVYSGTHDNDTSLGWYATAQEAARDHVRRYLRVDGSEVGWDFVRAAQASVCRLAVLPLADLMSLDGSARFNTPGQAGGNWQWRYETSQLAALHKSAAGYLRELAVLYGRAGR